MLVSIARLCDEITKILFNLGCRSETQLLIMCILLIATSLLLLYFYGTRNHNYWQKKGVKYEKPIILFGSALQPYIERVSFSERFANLYWRYPTEKYVGFYKMQTPYLLIRDLEMIKHVLATDFKIFHPRGIINHEYGTETLFQNIFHADGDYWKLMRQRLTPAFTSGKLKAMFPLIIERTDKLVKLAEHLTERSDEVDVRDVMAKYTTDFIGACGFGLDFDALNSEDSEFRKLGRRIFLPTTRNLIVTILKSNFPQLMSKYTYVDPDVERETLSLVKQIMCKRDYKPTGRNDFIDMMLELKQKGKIVGESIEKYNRTGSPEVIELDTTDELLTAQVFIFFAAGFETSSHASSFLLHMLAYHQEEQGRCQQEIDEVLKKYDGKLCFDALKEMKYLEMALREALRILPSPGFLVRKCVRKYTFPGTGLTVDPETKIIIPTQALHHDPKYFKYPEQFNPSRFEANDSLEKYAYMPFGEGPRMCIGERLGVMQSMAGVAAILSKFSVAPSRSSIPTPRIDPKSTIVQNIIGGLPLSMKNRI